MYAIYDKVGVIENLISGCSISVVQVLWEHLGWVRLPAARQGCKRQIYLPLLGGERLFYTERSQVERHLAT